MTEKTGDDRLFHRESGDWIKRKHHYLRRYCDMFTRAMAGKWPDGVHYADLMAGPGRCKVRETGEILPGSPLIALEYGFTSYTFFEHGADESDALERRLRVHPKGGLCSLRRESWIQAVETKSYVLPRGLVLVFVDPTGITQVPWSALSCLLAHHTRVDVLMTIQHGMAIRWNAHQYIPSAHETALDRFVGTTDWRKRYTSSVPVCSAVLDTYRDQMSTLGCKTREWEPVMNDQGSELYYMCLFSRHPLATDFWRKTVAVDEMGNRRLIDQWD